MAIKMTVNGVEAEVKQGSLASLFTPPKPKKRLVNEWGDAPTEVDTTEPLYPSSKEVEVVIGLAPTQVTGLWNSLLSKEVAEVQFLGRVVPLRVTTATLDRFSDALTEVRLSGVLDTPKVVLSKTPTTLSEALLEGSQLAGSTVVIKPGASEQVTGMVGGLYVTNGAVVQGRSSRSLKLLIKAKGAELWGAYDRLVSVLFAPKTLVDGVEMEYQSGGTSALELYGDTFYWEVDLNFLTL